MIKKTPNGIYFDDTLTCDLSRIKVELKNNFVDQIHKYAEGKITKAPKLVVTTAATHAGIITGNFAFYRPDGMRAGLPSFVEDGYEKPVLLHHDEMKDPVGRVKRAIYRDLSHKYQEPMQRFKERYGGHIFTDAKVDTDKAFDQVQWVIDNLIPMNDYIGLGYGELDLYINDVKAAEKILDQRYLTVSVGFTSDAAFCSICHQDWATEGFCDHERGKTYDSKSMVMIPGKFNYEEVSWVNTPADKHAKVMAISENISYSVEEELNKPKESLQFVANTSDSMVIPILISVIDGKVIRLDSFKKITPEREQEVIEVTKQTDNTQQAPELIKFTVGEDELDFSKEAESFLNNADVKRENYLTSQENDHTHRVILDPATGNGYTTFDGNHSHEVMNKILSDAGVGKYNETTDKYEITGLHTHTMVDKIPPLTDSKEVIVDEPDEINVEASELIEDTQDSNSDAVKHWSEVITDYPSVVAARKSVTELELTDAEKARAYFEINKIVRERNIAEIESEFEVIELELIDPENEDLKIKMAFTSQESFENALKNMTDKARETNKDVLVEACTAIGIELKDSLLDPTRAEAIPLTKAQLEADAQELFNNINKTFIDKMIVGLLENGNDELRSEVSNYIIDRLIAEALIDDIFSEYNALQQELEDMKQKLTKVTKANREFYANKQNDLARVIVALKVALKKPEFTDLNESDVETKTKELQVRSVDSLHDNLTDLIGEFSNVKVKETNQVIDAPVDEPAIGNKVNKDRLNMDLFRDLQDDAYALAARLQSHKKYS